MRDIAKVQNTLSILNQFDLSAKKAFGQNFLVDLNIIQNIVSCAPIQENTCVIEIGPGIGALTEFIARKATKVIAYDIDARLKEVLAYSLSEYPNVDVRIQDFLSVDFNELEQELKDFDHICIISNLPYYITSELLTTIVLSPMKIDGFVGMMQKEVALKLTGKENSPLKLMMEASGDVKYEFTVSSQVFIPKPRVDSAVISLLFKENKEIDKHLFYALLQAGFKQKRKTLYNNLSDYLGDKERAKCVLEQAKIDSKKRAEQLNLSNWYNLYNQLL